MKLSFGQFDTLVELIRAVARDEAAHGPSDGGIDPDAVADRAREVLAEEDASTAPSLYGAREIIAGFLLWHDPAYKPSASESLEKLLAEAQRFMSATYLS